MLGNNVLGRGGNIIVLNAPQLFQFIFLLYIRLRVTEGV
jgi:hypothetical protein